MTYCSVSRCGLSGTIRCPPSKSYTHRAIFLAALAHTGKSTIRNVLRSADTDATIEACRRLGAVINVEGSSLIVTRAIRLPAIKNASTAASSSDTAGTAGGGKAIEIDAANSGTTIRVAAGIASLLDRRVILTGDSSLRTRPMQPLLDALSSMGASCRSSGGDGGGHPPLEVRGPISGGAVEIPGNVSSQFVTSLFLCAPLTGSGISIAIKGGMVSKPYLDATIGAMREFGVSIQTQVPYKRYHIAPQRIMPVARFAVPSDASSLALLLAAAALNDGDISIKAQMGTLPQGDEAFIDMLELMGARIEISDSAAGSGDEDDAAREETIHVHTDDNGLKGGSFDLSNHPDLLPPLAIMALGCSGRPVEIFNVGHARLKETDRISILARELPKLGISVKEREDGLLLDATESSSAPRRVQPRPPAASEPPRDGDCQNDAIHLDPENDHRLFMALCIAGMRVGGCSISDPDSTAVSYPRFIEDMKSLGAKIETV